MSGYNWDRFRTNLGASAAGKRAGSARKTQTTAVPGAHTVLLAPGQADAICAAAALTRPTTAPVPAVAALVQAVPVQSAAEVERIATAAAVRRIIGNSNPSLLSAGDRWDALPERSREILARFDGFYVPNKGNQ
jgi:hypothetical protein